MTAAPSDHTPDDVAAMRRIYDHLSAPDSGAPAICDAVIGFGVFDLRVAAMCGALHAAGRARRIVFTGGVGAGTGTLGRLEADAFLDELIRLYPAVSREDVIVENRSTNTGDNIRFTLGLLHQSHPGLVPKSGLRTVLLVASPARLRRVRLTWRQLVPEVHGWGIAPVSDLPTEQALHFAQAIDYRALLTGEIDRLRDYPAKGWIAAEPIPSEVLAAREYLAGRRTPPAGIRPAG
jgi:uncharacterized SAM-binding protein YcdF (DUF218 family)